MNFVSYMLEDLHNLDNNKILIIEKNEKYTIADLFTYIASAQQNLKNCEQGDRVLLLSNNNMFFIVNYFAIISLGLIVVPIFPRMTVNEISYIDNLVDAKIAVVEEKLQHKINNSSLELVTYDFIKLDTTIKFIEVESKDLAVINFTSGSTGNPKGVMISHKNLISNTSSIIKYLNITSEDRFLQVLPMAYCYGASWLHTILKVGGSLIINNAFLFPNKIVKAILDEKITGFGGVPSHFQILLRKSDLLNYEYPNIRFFAQAGGKLQTAYISQLVAKFGQSKIYIMYGQTEATARLSYLEPKMLDTKLESIGKGIPGVKLKVVKENGNKVNIGEIGELVAEGDNIMLGYWNDLLETEKVLKNDQLYTGDLAKIDDDGYIYIVDRKKTMIKSGGYRISSKEIENIVAELPQVVEVAVIAKIHEFKGEVPIVYTVVNSPDDQRENIMNYCKSKLPNYKWPDDIIVLKSLPKNESGKVLYAKLKQLNGV